MSLLDGSILTNLIFVRMVLLADVNLKHYKGMILDEISKDTIKYVEIHMHG